MERADQKRGEQLAKLSKDSKKIVDLIKQKLDGREDKDFFLDAANRTVTVFLKTSEGVVNFDTAKHAAFRLLIEEDGSEWSSIKSNIIGGTEFEIILRLKPSNPAR